MMETECKVKYKQAWEKKMELTNPRQRWCQRTISSHHYRGIAIYITLEELVEKARSVDHCQVCGRPLEWEKKYRGRVHFDSPTLDRINNDKFIDSCNTMIICHRCNWMKGELPLPLFINYCRQIVEHNKSVA